ncbi:hypothetical protein IU487_33385 [Nocardia puris]|uniref:Uncharacterized protein n=1 Tax=Nocardia puris TaxID=208602 RepID=A0A366D6U9_9NOCA|nr:hypothetical protein [Nocardia puris]MBF6215893.1 hypothetical protein [Nocardia puris]RBO85219.1 hypothetical protein DFR74_11567 [Nocardia puris]
MIQNNSASGDQVSGGPIATESDDHSEGRSVLVSTGATYPDFVAWLSQRLTSWSPVAMSSAPAPGE